MGNHPDWKKIKDTLDGGGVFVFANSKTTKSSTPLSIEPPLSTNYKPVDHVTRDATYRRLIYKSGALGETYRSALRNRGLSDKLIAAGIDRGWFANWQRGINAEWQSSSHNIAGIKPGGETTISCDGLFLPAIKDGCIVGGQIQPKIHVVAKMTGAAAPISEIVGKYIWLSSAKQGGVNAHTYDTGENPLFSRASPKFEAKGVLVLNVCEGALKSAIAALKFEERGRNATFLGAAGGQFTTKELDYHLLRYPKLKQIIIWPDAGDVMNLSVLARWRRTAYLLRQRGQNVYVAWWGQIEKHQNDVDELNTADFENLNIKPWKESVMAENEIETENPATDGETVVEAWPHFTTSSEKGLQRHEPNGDGGWRVTNVGNHMQAVARINNPEGNGAALQLEFKSTNGKINHWTMARADLAGEGSSIIAGLMSLNYGFKRRQKNLLLDYLHELGRDVERCYTVTESSGWVDKSFVMPDRTYGNTDLKFRDVEPSPDALTEMIGTLPRWQAEIAAKCAGNSRLIFALGAAFAAPLLPLVGLESGGFHIVGGTSIGKTTILRVAASVLGIKDIPHWRTTANGLESIATASNHMLLPLDEIGQADPKDVGNIAYMLANGQGKTRMTKNLTNRKGKTWLLMVLSTGEVELGEYMAQAGVTQKGGQEVRLPNIPAIPHGETHGCFENIHGAHTAQEFVAELDEAVRQHHGIAIDAYLSRLVVDVADPAFTEKLVTKMRAVEKSLMEFQQTSDSAVGRVAKRFSLVYVALELAHYYGLLPFEQQEIHWSVYTVFRDWFVARGGDGSIEIKQACHRIQQLLVENEHGNRIYTLPNNDGRQVYELLGYRILDLDKQTREICIPTVIFDKKLCGDVDKKELIAELQRRGWLIPKTTNDRSVHQRRINGRKEYFYVFSTGILSGIE
jgi:uncharacterized protein (DUF927 family)